MNESIEFDIKVNGKDAKTSINEVEKAQKDLDGTVEKTSNNIKVNWTKIGAAAAVVTAALGATMKQAVDLERATFGLTEQTKAYIKAASEQYGISQQVIAGFVKTGQTAGMSGEEIKKMVDQAIALGRAFPHESTESFVDNLVQLNRTGEAQGYIVDILEQKYGLMDQKLLTVEQKMLAVEEATKGVNDAFDKTRAANIDKTFEEISNMTAEFGNTLWDLADSSGALWAVEKGFLAVQLAALGYEKIISAIKAKGGSFLGYDMSEEENNLKRIEGRIDEVFKKIATGGGTKQPGADGLPKITAPDIAGKDKALAPFSPNITKEWVDYMVKENEKGAKKVSSVGKSINDDRKRLAEEAISINNQFWDDYNATTMSAYEYDKSTLDKQYEEYSKYVKDKAALDEWYNQQRLQLQEQFDTQMQAYADMGNALNDGLTRGIIRFTETGKANFKDMANSIIQDMLQIQIRSSMMSLFGGFNSGGGGLLGGAFNMLFNAKGNAFTNGSVTPFANGGVVDSPTMFPMANGAGIMGEAGSEVIAPLKRDSSGNMGVGAVAPVVNVNVQNYGNDKVQVQQNGNNIDVIISQISAQIERGTGSIGKSLENRYNLRKQ